MSEVIVGRNAILAALRSGRPINKIVLARGTGRGNLAEILSLARERRIPIQEAGRQVLNQIAPEGHHQGMAAYVAAKEFSTLDDVLAAARERQEDPLILLLDKVEDPRNLGAILRSVDAAGAHGVIIPERRAAQLTGVVAKTAAGSLEYVPVVRVSNLPRAMETLKKAGCWVVGADMDAKTTYWEQELTGPLVLALGSEGRGLSRLVRENCDFLVRIPMYGHVSSLNVAVAASLFLYEAKRQRG